MQCPVLSLDFLSYSEPNLKVIKELVYKRGYAKIDGQRIPITDNTIIEKKLGKQGIICKFRRMSRP
jgi:large subunit ribosomal protein L7e